LVIFCEPFDFLCKNLIVSISTSINKTTILCKFFPSFNISNDKISTKNVPKKDSLVQITKETGITVLDFRNRQKLAHWPIQSLRRVTQRGTKYVLIEYGPIKKEIALFKTQEAKKLAGLLSDILDDPGVIQ